MRDNSSNFSAEFPVRAPESMLV